MEYSKENPLLMIPGPVESNKNVLDFGSTRTLAHTEREFVEIFQSTLNNLLPIFDVSDQYSPLIVAGGGTLAMEIAMVNLIDKSENQKALICETGYFGDRFTTIADSMNLEYEKISSQAGHKLTEENLVESLEKDEFDFAFIQHVDTSTGVANDIQTFGNICKENDVISVVDGVCALGGQELHQEDWNIDIYLTGAQKALAVPPGLAIMMYSPEARHRSQNRNEKLPSYYADLENWWPIMDAYHGGSVSYFSTPATNLIAALYQSTKNLLDEGMDKVYDRHEKLAMKFRSRMREMDFDFITAEDSLANTLSTPKYKDKEHRDVFMQNVLDKGVLIAGGIQQDLADSYFRVGHMGNINEEQIDFTLQAIKEALT